jgi:membrane protein
MAERRPDRSAAVARRDRESGNMSHIEDATRGPSDQQPAARGLAGDRPGRGAAGGRPGPPSGTSPARGTRAFGTARRWARDLTHEWQEDRVGGLAAEIAFFALLSIFPALVAVTGALGLLEGIVGDRLAADAEEEVVGFFERILTDDASDTVDAVRELFREATPGALTAGGLAALWAASRAFAAVTRALDVVYDIPERRGYVRLRALALALALGSVLVGAVMLAMLVLGPLLGTGRDIADRLDFGGGFAAFWDVVRWPLMAVLLTAWAATLFHVAPNHRTPWRWDLPGAALCAAGWFFLSIGFSTYLQVAAGTNQVLGALGGSVILVLWLYLLAISLLVGGEVNALLAAHRGRTAAAGTGGAGGGGAESREADGRGDGDST